MEKSFLETTPIPKLMRKYAVPCVVSLLVAALYNIVDQIFIANASYLGSNGNAANTVVFPLTVIALAVSVMIGDGCCTFVSLSLGRKQTEDASGGIGSAVLCCITASLLLTACYLASSEPLLALFGGTVNEETFRLSKEYFFWIALGIPFYMFGQCMNPIIRSDGSPRFAMIATLAGAAVNLVLDPLFIFGFHWGMMGAAVATVLGQVLTAGLSVWYLAHMRLVKLEKKSFHFHPRLIRQYVPLGICSFLSQASLVAAMAAINGMTRQYGALDPIFGQSEYAQIPMAVIGIVMKFFQIIISISIGLAAGCIPIVGVSCGRRAQRTDPSGVSVPSAAGGGGGRSIYADRGAFPLCADRHFRRGKRERLLYPVCRPVLPDLSVPDDAGHGQQGHLYFPAIHGQAVGFHAAFHGA